jgi:hypothetical protein
MPPKKAWSEKNQPKILFFTTSEKENPRTQVQPEANEPIEVDDDVSHEASKKGIVNFVDVISFLININQWLKRSNVNKIHSLKFD